MKQSISSIYSLSLRTYSSIIMIPSLTQIANLALGLDAQQLNFWQMGLRAAIIYVAALIMVRIVGDRRFIGKYAAFDVILSIIFGSTLSHAINGSSAFLPLFLQDLS